jgi:putative DNA primase/helicase
LTFGCFKGAAVYFGFRDNDNSTWVIAEGIETCLSAMTMLRASGEFGRSGPQGIAALSAGGLRYVCLPKYVRRVVIAADNDESGREAARSLRYRLWRERRTVSIAIPPKEGTDWNDVLIANQQAELENKYNWLDHPQVMRIKHG